MSLTAAEFEALYHRHSKAVWAVAYARRLEPEAARDVTQEAFSRLWKQALAGEVIRHPKAWLLRVARNLAEDYAKCAFSRNGTQPPEAMAALAGRWETPLDAAVAAEEREQVRRFLAGLAEADREVLTLKYALGYGTEAIAAELGVSAAAVHMRLSRARQRLAQCLTPPPEQQE